MKKIVASVGMVAVGASGLQAAVLPALTEEAGKPWNVSATLRGFYDDNINTTTERSSTTGFEVSPGLQFAFPMEQTTLSFGYIYSYKYYENKPLNQTDHFDQTHSFNAALSHAFSERYQLTAKDAFVIGQEPDFIRAGNTFTTFQRVSGNNDRNYGTIDFSAQITPEWGADLGYANTFYSYADNHIVTDPATGLLSSSASTSGLLDEIDHTVHLDLRYQIQPQTVGILGYQFRYTDYIGDQPIGVDLTTDQNFVSDDRNAEMHYVYVGIDQNFRPDLTASVRAGGRYTEYPNNPHGQSETSPYAMASLRYTYLPESWLEAGFSYDYSPSSVFSSDPRNGELTLSAQSATLYATLRHRITPKLYGSLMGQYQNSTYYGGPLDNKQDNYYLLGLNLQYRFTPNFSAEAGYNYDYVGSEVGHTYHRNRVYIGVTGSY